MAIFSTRIRSRHRSSRQVKWVAPPTVTSPSINGVPFPLIDKVQPILSKMPVEIMDNILTRSSELVQFEDCEFWLGPKRNVSLSGVENEYEHAYIGELRLCYSDPWRNVEQHFAPLEVLLAIVDYPHSKSGDLTIHLFTRNTFDVS
jgi:hypothetical protein